VTRSLEGCGPAGWKPALPRLARSVSRAHSRRL